MSAFINDTTIHLSHSPMESSPSSTSVVLIDMTSRLLHTIFQLTQPQGEGQGGEAWQTFPP